MFCTKCGNQLLDDSAFCSKCGTKLTENDMNAQAPMKPVVVATQQTFHPTPQITPPPIKPKKKKSKILPIILAVIGVIFVLGIIGVSCSDFIQEHGSSKLVIASGDSNSSEMAKSNGVSLSETYTNEAEGISFKYPKAWKVVSQSKLGDYYDQSEFENVVALLANEQDDPELSSYIELLRFPATKEDIDYYLSSTESVFKENFDPNVSINDLSHVDLDGIPARMVSYTTMEDEYYRSYFYAIGSDLYRINFLRKTIQTESLEKFFDTIIESYTVTHSKNATGSKNPNTDKILYKGVPVFSFFDHIIDDVFNLIGTPISKESYGDQISYDFGDIFIYTCSQTGELISVAATNPSALSINGVTLDMNRAGIIELLGEPAEEGPHEMNDEYYELIYNIGDLQISFGFYDDPDGKVNIIGIAPPFDAYDGYYDMPSMGDFNKSIYFGDLEIVIYSDHEIARHTDVGYVQSDYIFLFPHITNVGNSPTTLDQYNVSVFGPNGMEMTPVPDIFNNNVFYDPLSQGRGNIMPGASQTLAIILPYNGAGDYTVYFSDFTSQANLTLPISRNTASSSYGLVGSWALDSGLSNGYYATTGLENIEFLENGSGYITVNGTTNTIDWYIQLNNQGSRFVVKAGTSGNALNIYSDALMSYESLSLSNTSTFRMWTSAGIIRDETIPYEGEDVFIRN